MLEVLELLWQPVALVAWALVAVAGLCRRADVPAAARRLVTALAVFYFAVATPLGANLVVGALEGPATPAPGACLEPARGSAVVVLAGGVSGDPLRGDDVARLQVESLRRVIEGLRLARASDDAVLVLAGGGGRVVREADLMAAFASELGFPASRLLLERESRTTAEGAGNVARLLAPRSHGSGAAVRLVTSALHMPRAAATFRRQGIEVCPVPVDRRWVGPDAGALVPQITALEKSTAACHELVGYAVYWATGRL